MKFWRQTTLGLRMLSDSCASVYQAHLQKNLPKILSESCVQKETKKG